MKVLNLAGPDIQQLWLLPETGMGFQLVETIWWGNRAQFLVFNSEIAIDISHLKLEPTKNLATLLSNEVRILDAMKGDTETVFTAPGPHSFNLLSTRVSTIPSVAPAAYTAAAPSSLVKHVSLTRNRIFHRFSAFNPDRRVDPKTGDFIAGTYAAPDSEVPFVPTGFAAVGRFALPNNLPASHHYVIEAPGGTSVSFGTVAPAFAQAGGGVEAFFRNAVSNQQKPHTPPSQLPDE